MPYKIVSRLRTYKTRLRGGDMGLVGLDQMVIDAAEVMLLQRCSELNFDMECVPEIMTRAITFHSYSLRVTCSYVFREGTNMHDLLEDVMDHVERQCFGSTVATEESLFTGTANAMFTMFALIRWGNGLWMNHVVHLN